MPRTTPYRRTGLALGTVVPDARRALELQTAVEMFPDKRNRRIDPTRLHVVAMLQDMQTGDILQATMIKLDNGQHAKPSRSVY